MSSNNNLLTAMLNQLNRSSIKGTNLSQSLTATNLVSSLLTSSSGSGSGSQLRPGADGGAKTLPFSSKDSATGIQFGSPSSSSIGSTGPSAWTSLLRQTASGGIGSALGGGGLNVLGALGGIGGLISGLSGLFGGKSTPPPLVEFQLPQVQAETVYIGGKGSSSQSVAGGSSSSTPATYTNASPASAQNLTYQSTQIAQAVKQAILNSSSLNDVIAEI